MPKWKVIHRARIPNTTEHSVLLHKKVGIFNCSARQGIIHPNQWTVNIRLCFKEDENTFASPFLLGKGKQFIAGSSSYAKRRASTIVKQMIQHHLEEVAASLDSLVKKRMR